MAISQLQEMIENSVLSSQDKDMWLHTMEMLDDEQAEAILKSIGDDPHELELLTRNIKLKQIGFATGDMSLLEQVLADEENDLKGL